MAYAETLTKIVCRILVNIGTTSTGAVKTANVNLPTVSTSGYSAATFGAMCELIEPVLNETLYTSTAIKTYEVEDQ